MLTLLLVSLWEFKQFLQIVLWIAIPGTVIAIVITTVLHYRRKKNLLNEPAYAEALAGRPDFAEALAGELPYASASPDVSAVALAKAENTSLLKKYEREIRRYKENYSQLEQDYRDLEQKYGDLLNKAYHNDQSGNEAIDQLHQELKTYKLKIAQLQQAIDFRDPNNAQAQSNDAMELHDLRIKISQLEEENNVLKSGLEETRYIHEVLEEKKLQTVFLQQQLELRIKNYHQLEKQTSGASAELAQLRTAADEFNSKEQALLIDLEQKHEAIREQAELVQKLESGLEELQQQQVALQSIIDEKQGAIGKLEGMIDHEQQRTKELENKLEMSNQLFARIYSELAISLDAGLLKSQNGNGAAIIGPVTTTN